MKEALDRSFLETFGRLPDVTARASGRVNIIGEHTDYSGGFVLPIAIPQTTRVALARRSDNVVRASSISYAADGLRTFVCGEERKQGSWIDYVQGVIVAMRARGMMTPPSASGFDLQIASDIPIGAGVSSSAALDVALLRALRVVFALEDRLEDTTLAQIARAAETDFVGAPVGIMDPMAATFADVATALLIDTRSLDVQRISLPDAAELIVIDSGVTHAHASGGYASRHDEVIRAAKALGVEMLRDVTDASVIDDRIDDPVLRRRARHVVSENARVLDAAACLRANDLVRLGMLLDGSHASLRDDFEVTIPEVDHLVATAQADPDVLGARMTGGGFGGAIVALTRTKREDRDGAAEVARRVLAEHGDPRARVLVPRPA